MNRQLLRGLAFAVLCVVAAIALRRPIIELAPPRALDIFLLGIGLTSFLFSWIPAALLLAASLVLAAWIYQPVTGAADALRLGLYAIVSAAGIAAIHRLKEAVRHWRQTEESYRSIFEDASDAIAVADADLNLLEVNARMCEVLGYERTELLKLNIRQLVFRGDLDTTPFRFEEVLVQGRTVVQERRFRRKDGSILAGEVSVRKLRDGRLIAIGRDVTQRKQAEESLRQSEAVTRSVIYTAVDGIITTDERGTIQLFNPAAERMFGYSAEEVLGKNVSLLMPSPDRERHDSYMAAYVKTGVARIIGIGREVTGMRADGTTFPLELAVSEALLPEGRVFTGLLRDITQRKQAEEALRQAHETLRAVIQTSPLAIFTVDLQGNVKTWNVAAEQVFGWSEAEVVGRPLPVVPESDREELLDALARAAAGEMLAGLERQRLRKDGSLIDVAIWNAPLRDSSGITGVMGVIADVTERKRMEAQLAQAQKMDAIGRLAGGVAHDFNNILTVITGYSELLRIRLEADGPASAEIAEILKAAQHAAALTDQLLVFSRHQVVSRQLIDLNAVVVKVDKMLRRIIGEDIELVTLPGPDLGYVRADASQIEQVLLNLAANARDAMPGGGRLTIETASVEIDESYTRTHAGVNTGRYVLLAVSDTGTGMDAQTRSRLFEPFFTTKERGKGTGLGLSIVYGIVKQSGGHIWVYTELDRGTTFKVYLPVVQEPREQPARAIELPPPGGAETVLLVEDEGGVRKLVRGVLETHGYRVLEAEDVQDALRICERLADRIHLLLTDVVMPQMSGRDLAERALAIRPGLKVLYMSGYTDNVIVHHGVIPLSTPFLQKPFTPVALARKVRQVLDSGPAN